MKKNIHFTVSILAMLLSIQVTIAQMAVKNFIVPVYPTEDSSVMIYLNTNYWPNIDTSKIDVYTGLITSNSADIVNSWQDVVPASWGDHPDSLKMKRLNDSIYWFAIKNIRSFYKAKAGETIFRIAFIARDQSTPQHQTENLYFEIYANDVKDSLVSAQPLKPLQSKPFVTTFNISKSKRSPSLFAAIVNAPLDSVFVWTGVRTEKGNFLHNPVSAWTDLPTKAAFKALRVNDSIFRFYTFPDARTFYALTDTCEHIKGANYVVRNSSGNAQTEDLFVQFDTTAYKACTKTGIETTQNSGINIFPNPAREMLTVKTNSVIIDVSITNIAGQVVLQFTKVNDKQFPVSLNGIRSGIYFISVRDNNNKVSTLKFMKE
jgi:hypothetical protein